MKNIISISAAIFLLVLSACESDLDQTPISDSTVSTFYQDEEDFEQAINGMYNSLLDYSTYQFYMSEVRSDNVYAPGSGVRDWNPINNFASTLESNSLMEECWEDTYRGIYLANCVLDNITTSIVTDEDTYNQMIGEAKFVRALYYLTLVQFYGKVPLYDHVPTVSESLEIGRSDVSDVYDLIVSDLETAIENLPDSYDTDETGKATSWAAEALLARVYLTMSGPTYDIEGPGIAADKYTDALTLLNDVINNGPYSWVSDYSQIFAYDNENNGDIVFDVQAIDDGSTSASGMGTILPSLMYLESWASVNLDFAGGVSDDGQGGIRPSDDLLYTSCEDADIRDDFSVLFSFTNSNGSTVNTPFYIKYLDVNYAPYYRYNWPINFPVIRYTDVLLMKAEALLQTEGTSASVDAIVNQVRERAGLKDISDVDLDDLLKERRNEFMGEGLRWHDLVRTGKAIEVMNNWRDEDDTAGSINEIVANYIIYAIPQDQLEVKDGLYEQNPGY